MLALPDCHKMTKLQKMSEFYSARLQPSEALAVMQCLVGGCMGVYHVSVLCRNG